jgi:hypothetical protein
MTTARAVTEEHWLPPRGRAMIGVSRTVRDDSLTGYELLVLREAGAGLTYAAHPSGQPAAVFHSRTVADSMVVFENPAHDFPQVIGYRRIGADSLHAWIEGPSGGRLRRVDFPYRRIACAGN